MRMRKRARILYESSIHGVSSMIIIMNGRVRFLCCRLAERGVTRAHSDVNSFMVCTRSTRDIDVLPPPPPPLSLAYAISVLTPEISGSLQGVALCRTLQEKSRAVAIMEQPVNGAALHQNVGGNVFRLLYSTRVIQDISMNYKLK